jgi:hypothetical protein
MHRATETAVHMAAIVPKIIDSSGTHGYIYQKRLCQPTKSALNGSLAETEPTLAYKNKQTPWPLVRKRTIPTDRPSLGGEI